MIMLYNIEDRLIVELLKKTPDSTVVESLLKQPDLSYKYFFEMLQRHMVESEVLYKLMKYPLADDFKKKASVIFKKSSFAMISNNMLIKSEMLHIIKILNENGIETILMKGLSLDFSGFRVCRDLDILIGQDDLIKSIDLLKPIGYINIGNELNYKLNKIERVDIRQQFLWNNQYQLFNSSKNLLLEIHTNLFERKKVYYDNLEVMLDRVDDLWKRRVYDESLGVHIFSNEDLLILMCMHVAIKRNFSGNSFVLRNLLDVERLISNNPDWGLFLAIAEKMNISHYIYFALLLSKEIFFSDIPESVFDTLKQSCSSREFFLIRLHFRCFKNLKNNSPVNSFMFKIIASIFYNRKWRFLKVLKVVFSLIFPPRWRMTSMTGVKSNSPLIVLIYILNPLRMLILFFKNLFVNR